jgi:hypothetical protein
MKNSINAAIVGPIILVLNGCVPVKFCSNPVSFKNSGFKYPNFGLLTSVFGLHSFNFQNT